MSMAALKAISAAIAILTLALAATVAARARQLTRPAALAGSGFQHELPGLDVLLPNAVVDWPDSRTAHRLAR